MAVATLSTTLAGVRAALKAGDSAQAETGARQLLKLAPDDPDVQGFVAAVLLMANRHADALALLRGLPENLDRLLAMSVCYEKTGQRQQAENYVRRVLLARPHDIDAQMRLAALKRSAGKRVALGRDTPADKALRAGNLARGFPLLAQYIAIQRSVPYRAIDSRQVPHWRGERVKRLLVIGAAGDGDTLQFARYLPAAAERCERITVAVRPPLMPLLKRSGWNVAGLFGLADLLRDADAQAEMMALPASTGHTYGPTAGYLKAGTPRDYGPGFHVGVNWTASEEAGARRTVPVEMLQPLASVPGVTFHCLTFGERAKAAPSWVQPLALGDYADTADAMAGLDLVITVDSSPAHLAGALGVPVWVALPGRADWRFETHPHRWAWYSSARLFRGAGAFERMACEMRALIDTQGAVEMLRATAGRTDLAAALR
jgi:hypothetical protein